MSERKIQIKAPGIEAVDAAKQLRYLGGFAREAGMSPEAAKQMHDRMALIPPAPRRPWRHRLDIEKIAVVLIAIFVAAIAVNHFRLVNARVEAARPCADQRR